MFPFLSTFAQTFFISTQDEFGGFKRPLERHYDEPFGDAKAQVFLFPMQYEYRLVPARLIAGKKARHGVVYAWDKTVSGKSADLGRRVEVDPDGKVTVVGLNYLKAREEAEMTNETGKEDQSGTGKGGIECKN